jgi:hypothetical protein
MPHWLLKAGTQKVISWLPRSDSLNYVFQKYVTKTARLRPDWFDHKIDQAARHLRNWAEAQHQGRPHRAMELGTGWHPVVPLALAVAGVDEVLSIDRNNLVRAANVGAVLRMFVEAADDGRLAGRLEVRRPDRVEIMRSLAADPQVTAGRLADIGVAFLVGDARGTDLPPASVDLFTSNNTLEHIPPEVLVDILVEMRRLAAPGAVLSHFIDLSDHYSHFDGSLSPYNFLRYSDSQWRLLNNRLVFQNRLRVPAYRRLFSAAGLDLVDEDGHTPQPVADIDSLRLPAALRAQPAADILVTHAWFTAVVGARPRARPLP